MLGIRQFSETFACFPLVDACQKYLQKNFTQVADGEEFLNLSYNDVVDIIARDELNVASESEVSLNIVLFNVYLVIFSILLIDMFTIL